MNILRYEFQDSPEGSINAMIGDMVAQIRYGYSQVQIEEFKIIIENMRKVEKKLQEIDAEINLPVRNYIQEIMDELERQSNVENELIEDLEWTCKAIINNRFNLDCNLDEFLFSFRNEEAVSWLEFFGYNAAQETDLKLIIARSIFKSVCTKFNVIFLDLS